MRYAKPCLLFGALIILGSSAAFEWATFSKSFEAYQVPPIAQLAGFLGAAIWLAGCIRISRKISARTLFGSGGLILIFLAITVSILDRINPALFNVHIGFGGMFAPVLACLFSSLIFLFVGLMRPVEK